MIKFDHIAIACTTLSQGTAEVEKALGVPLETGGKHQRYGTHNTLLGMGDLYLEVIARDPDASPPRAAWFALDHFSGPTRPANWICRTDDITQAPAICGPAQQLERGDLRWQITVPDDGSLPCDGAYPTLITWDPGTTTPAARLPDRGVRLIRWEVSHPNAATIAANLDIDDPRVVFINGDKGFRAVLETPSGEKSLA